MGTVCAYYKLHYMSYFFVCSLSSLILHLKVFGYEPIPINSNQDSARTFGITERSPTSLRKHKNVLKLRHVAAAECQDTREI